MNHYDIVISGATIVTMDPSLRVLEGYSLAVENGIISDIFAEGSREVYACDYLDASGCLLIPGLINGHTHLGMTYFRGLADDLPLDKWLGDYIWPLEAKLIKHQFVYDATLHGAAELLKNGVTHANDMYFQMSAVAEACTTAGMRSTVSEALIGIMLDQDKLASAGDDVLSLRKRYADNRLVSFSLAPHAIYTCNEELLRRVAKIARDNDLLVHMHLSESREEVLNCQRDHGKSPVRYLKDLGILDCRTVFAHGIWVNEEEMDLLAESGSSIAICTDSNLKLASGIAPITQYLKHGVNLCLATDGVASNNNLDLLAEMDVTAKLHKAIGNDPSLLPAVELLKMGTINAAKALGCDRQTGSIETGKAADLVIIDLANLQSQPIYNPYSHLVYAISSHSVRDVLVDGKLVMRDRRLNQVDESALLDKAASYKQEVLKSIRT